MNFYKNDFCENRKKEQIEEIILGPNEQNDVGETVCKLISELSEEDLENDLQNLFEFCQENFGRCNICIDFATNIVEIMKLLDIEQPKISIYVIKILSLFAKYYPNESKSILNNVLVFFPLTALEIDDYSQVYEHQISLINAMIIGFDVLEGANEIEKTNFYLDFFRIDTYSNNEYNVKCLILLDALLKNVWPISNSLSEIIDIVVYLVTYFAISQFSSDEGKIACCESIQICCKMLEQDPNCCEEVWSKLILSVISKNYLMFSNVQNNVIDRAFLRFYIEVSKCKTDAAKRILLASVNPNIVGTLIISSSIQTSKVALRLICNFYKMFPNLISNDEISNAMNVLSLMGNEDICYKSIAMEYFFILFANWNDLICNALIDNGIIGVLHDMFDSDQEILVKYAKGISSSIIKNRPDLKDDITSSLDDIF